MASRDLKSGRSSSSRSSTSSSSSGDYVTFTEATLDDLIQSCEDEGYEVGYVSSTKKKGRGPSSSCPKKGPKKGSRSSFSSSSSSSSAKPYVDGLYAIFANQTTTGTLNYSVPYVGSWESGSLPTNFIPVSEAGNGTVTCPLLNVTVYEVEGSSSKSQKSKSKSHTIEFTSEFYQFVELMQYEICNEIWDELNNVDECAFELAQCEFEVVQQACLPPPQVSTQGGEVVYEVLLRLNTLIEAKEYSDTTLTGIEDAIATIDLVGLIGTVTQEVFDSNPSFGFTDGDFSAFETIVKADSLVGLIILNAIIG